MLLREGVQAQITALYGVIERIITYMLRKYKLLDVFHLIYKAKNQRSITLNAV